MSYSMPRLGKIKVGIKQGNRPVSVNHFVFPQASGINSIEAEEIVKSLIDKCGVNPSAVDIMLPNDDINVFMPRSYKRYVKSGVCICKSKISIDDTGKEIHSGKATFTDPSTREGKEIPCSPESCEHIQSGNCKKVSDLYFFLPSIKGFGVWQITTRAFTSMGNILNATQFIKSQTGGKVALIPLRLAIVKNTVPRKDNGKTINQEVNSLSIDLGNLTLDQLLKYSAPAPAAAVTAPIAPTDESKVQSPTTEQPISEGEPEQTSGEKPMSETTKARVARAFKDAKLSTEKGKELMKKHFNVSSSSALTESQAEEFIEIIKKESQKGQPQVTSATSPRTGHQRQH
ncbi:MAG: recombination directionality factor [Bacillota bacterium]